MTVKRVNIINCVYAIICILSILGSSMNFLEHSLRETNKILASICHYLFGMGPIGVIITTMVPFGPIACIWGNFHAWANRKNADYQRKIGRKEVWLAIWPVLDGLLWFGAVCALVYFSGGV